MVLAFHDREVLIYTNTVPRGTTVNAEYIIRTLKVFLKRMKQKRPLKLEAGFILHWDNAPVHTAHKVRDFLASKEMIKVTVISPTVRTWPPVTSSCFPS